MCPHKTGVPGAELFPKKTLARSLDLWRNSWERAERKESPFLGLMASDEFPPLPSAAELLQDCQLPFGVRSDLLRRLEMLLVRTMPPLSWTEEPENPSPT